MKKILRIGGYENLSFLEWAILIFLLLSHENKSKFTGWQGWVKILIKANVTALFDPDQTF